MRLRAALVQRLAPRPQRTRRRNDAEKTHPMHHAQRAQGVQRAEHAHREDGMCREEHRKALLVGNGQLEEPEVLHTAPGPRLHGRRVGVS